MKHFCKKKKKKKKKISLKENLNITSIVGRKYAQIQWIYGIFILKIISKYLPVG